MVVLLSLLVLAVGFVALGTWVSGAGALLVFGVAFIALAVAFLTKLLIVSHVHIRGTTGRLEALNKRYDDTARWLERYDADTRESFLATKSKLDQAETDRLEILGEVEKLREDTPRIEAMEALGAGLDSRLGDLSRRQEEAVEAQTKATASADKRLSESQRELSERLGALRADLDELASLSEHLDALRSDVENIEGQAESGRVQIAEVQKLLEEAQAQIDDKLRLVNGRVSKIDDTHERKRMSSVTAAKEAATSAIEDVSKRLDEAVHLNARQRGDGYVRFPRLISGEAVQSAKAMGFELMPGEVKYLERKLQVLEGLCEGRLAGSVDDAVGRMLAGCLVNSKELNILEIGVLFGVGAAYLHHTLAPRFDRVRLVLLDPFEGYYGKDHLDPLTGLPVTRASVERNMMRCGIPSDDVEILEGFSTDDKINAAAESAGPFHLIVIDGDHSAEGIRADFDGYASMLKPGGMLVIDDYGSEDWPAVTVFVDETVRDDPRFKLVAVIGKTAVFKRLRVASAKKAASKTSKKTPAKAAKKKAGKKTTGGDESAGSKQVESKPKAAESSIPTDRDPPVPVVRKKGRSRKAAPKKAAHTGRA